MKPTIENLQDSFRIGYENFKSSRVEAEEVMELYHNRQYSEAHRRILERRGQPQETFNVIKMFSRMFLGYLSSVINEVKVVPRQQQDIYTAAVLNDLVNYTFQTNNFIAEAQKVKLDGILTGLMCVYENVRRTGELDRFGRPLYEITLEHIPSNEIILDPHSRKEDYSDAKFVHRYRWISKEDFELNFGKSKLDQLSANMNETDAPEADLHQTFNTSFEGKYKHHDNYLVVHTIMKDVEKGRNVSYSVFWCGDVILNKQKISYDKVAFPYRIQKLQYSTKAEYYGLFREIIETQKSINQAILKIQTMVNSKMIFVEKGSVDNLQNFTDAVNKVNAVIPVNNLNGVRAENQIKDIREQYGIIDNALARIKQLLSINDSFLGISYPSESGRKVQLQQQASVIALKYLTSNIESFYRLLGEDIMYLIQQFYTAEQVFNIADEYAGQRFLTINQPIQRLDPRTGQPMVDAQGEPVYLMAEVFDKDGNVKEDTEGRILMEPVPTRDSEIAFTKADIIVESVAYNDDLTQNQQLLLEVLNGNMGQFIQNTNPAGYAHMASLAMKNMKARVSPELADIFAQTAQMIQASQQQMMQQQAMLQQFGGQQPQQGDSAPFAEILAQG